MYLKLRDSKRIERTHRKEKVVYMARKMATYIIYYTDKTGYADGFTVYGSKRLFESLKWLHSEEIKATDIEIYKEGKNFDNDQDDVIEVYRQYWK
jgi:hypothetical protein